MSFRWSTNASFGIRMRAVGAIKASWRICGGCFALGPEKASYDLAHAKLPNPFQWSSNELRECN